MNAALRLSIKQWAPQDRPSDKLQNLGAEQMSDAELISLLVGCGTAQQSAVDVANNILRKFGNNLNALGKARLDELEDIEGVGVQTACKIMAAVELGRRRQMAAAEPKPDMGTAVRIYNYMFPRMRDLQTEEFHILLMNQNYRLIKSVRISQGGITETCADIAAVHNHPSGCLTPSKCDDTLTMAIKKACEVMRIHFLDHVIVTDGAYYSYHEVGKL